MKQTNFDSTGFELVIKRTYKSVFFEKMNVILPLTKFIKLIENFGPAVWENAKKKAQTHIQTNLKSVKLGSQTNIISPGKLLSFNAHFYVGYTDIPQLF